MSKVLIYKTSGTDSLGQAHTVIMSGSTHRSAR